LSVFKRILISVLKFPNIIGLVYSLETVRVTTLVNKKIFFLSVWQAIWARLYALPVVWQLLWIPEDAVLHKKFL